MDVRVFQGRFNGGIPQGIANRHDDIVAIVDELAKVVGVVLGIGGFNELEAFTLDQAQGCGGCQNPFPGGLVEATVVDSSDIGD